MLLRFGDVLAKKQLLQNYKNTNLQTQKLILFVLFRDEAGKRAQMWVVSGNGRVGGST